MFYIDADCSTDLLDLIHRLTKYGLSAHHGLVHGKGVKIDWWVRGFGLELTSSFCSLIPPCSTTSRNSIEWCYAEEEPVSEVNATADGEVTCPRLLPTATQERGNFKIWLRRRKVEWRANRKVGREPSPEPPRAKDPPPRSVATASPKPATLISAAVSTSNLGIITPPVDDSPDNCRDICVASSEHTLLNNKE